MSLTHFDEIYLICIDSGENRPLGEVKIIRLDHLKSEAVTDTILTRNRWHEIAARELKHEEERLVM